MVNYRTRLFSIPQCTHDLPLDGGRDGSGHVRIAVIGAWSDGVDSAAPASTRPATWMLVPTETGPSRTHYRLGEVRNGD